MFQPTFPSRIDRQRLVFSEPLAKTFRITPRNVLDNEKSHRRTIFLKVDTENGGTDDTSG